MVRFLVNEGEPSRDGGLFFYQNMLYNSFNKIIEFSYCYMNYIELLYNE